MGTDLLVDGEEGDSAERQPTPEARGDVSCARATTAFVDDERDDPATDRYFYADVGEEEESHKVDAAEAEYLLVLVDALEGIFGLLACGLAGFLETFCHHPKNHSVSMQAESRSKNDWHDGPASLLNLNVKAWNTALMRTRPMWTM